MWTICSDTRFNLFRVDGRRRVYRRRNERYADCCVIERDRFGGDSVMVWGGIVYGRRTQLHIIRGNLNAIKYRDNALASKFGDHGASTIACAQVVGEE
jgi:hypothetical protein